MPRFAGAVVLAMSLAGAIPAAGQAPAQLSGVLVRRDSSVVVSARVRLVRLDRAMLTDDQGRFLFRDVAPGRYELSILAPGGAPVSMEVVLLPGEEYHTRIVFAEEAQRLQDITVAAEGPPRDATSRRLEAFNRRRQRGLGVFLTRADIERRQPRLLSDALAGVQSIRLMERGSGKVVIAARGLQPVARTGGYMAAPCMLRLVIDGMPQAVGASLDQVSPHEVAGIEIYPGAASMPVEFAHFQEDSWCGVVAIWTRGG